MIMTCGLNGKFSSELFRTGNQTSDRLSVVSSLSEEISQGSGQSVG